ncbi:MAG: sigma-70 family RNA polymerase sigma factor [Ignavibacteriaceae bacterium]
MINVTSKDNITQLLAELTGGNNAAVDALMPLVYDELHQVAHMHLRKERRNHTLNATALVHEAYFKLVDQTKVNWQNRAHFFAIASQAMRRILINYALQRKAQKRGGDDVKITFVDENVMRESKPEELLALDEALNRLKLINERQSKIIEYWFFVGLTHEEIAEVLGISVPTVRRDWRLARAWLSRELKKTV